MPLKEDEILENAEIDEKISATKHKTLRLAARQYLEESCELAKLLPPKKRILFVMHFSHGFTIKEIAEICKETPNTVINHLRRITTEINMMRNCMKVTDNGKVNKSTKERIEGYFRRQDKRRRSNKKRKYIDPRI